jgi:MFS family permease
MRTSRPFNGKGLLAPLALITVGFASSTIVTPLYPFYQAKFGFSVVMLTVIYGAYVIGNLLALLALGRLSDRVGRRPVAFSALALCTTATLFFIAATGSSFLFAGRMISGAGVGLASGTGAAWLVDIDAGNQSRASFLATEANMAGIGLAPLIAGLLASAAPRPLLLPYLVYFGAIVLAAGAVLSARETVRRSNVDLRVLLPSMSLPIGSRARFIAPAATGFVAFAFVGFYAALLPHFLRDSMRIADPKVCGSILAGMFGVAAATLAATRRVPSRISMLGSAIVIIPALLLFLGAQMESSLFLLLGATLLGGIALALAYRAGLEIVASLASPDQRAGLISTYLVACFAGNSLPVIGVALLARRLGSASAGEIFAGVLLALAVVAFATGLAFAPRQLESRTIKRSASN